jgi:rRNA-processing protein FCF1
VVLDTNVLFLVVRVGFPLEEEVDRALPGARLLVPGSVVGELEGLAKSLTPGAMAARALADRYEVVATTERGDDGVLEAATTAHAWVATADRELRRRLSIRGITALVPRDRHRLEVVAGRPPPPSRTRRPARPISSGGNG